MSYMNYMNYMNYMKVSEGTLYGVKACGANIYTGLFRVTNIRFSKCSDVGFGNLTQPFEIRHPWLSSHSRQRPVAELLDCGQSIK